MDSIKKKIQHKLNKSASHHGKHKKIVVVPDESLRRREEPYRYGQAASSTMSTTSSIISPMPGSSKLETTKVKDVPVAQLVDLSIPDTDNNTPPIKLASNEVSQKTGIAHLKEDPTWAWTLNESPAAASKLLLFLPFCVQCKVLSYLPVRDLLSLAQVNQTLNQLTKEELERRQKKLKMQLVWRKDFIRYTNQSYNAATKVVLTRHHVFGPIWKALFFRPAFVIVCYSPDVFEYEIRLQVKDTSKETAHFNHNVFNPDVSANDPILIKEKPGTLLDHVMRQTMNNQKEASTSSIWHMRLFTVLKPHRNNPTETYLWSSEDLSLLFFPNSMKITFTKGPIEYSDLMDYPMLNRYYANHNMLRPIIEMINHRFRPKFLILSIKDFPENFQPVAYSFPVIVCDISPFKNYPEEFLCFSGDDVKVHQVVLEAKDSRTERDEKIRALHSLCKVEAKTTLPGNSIGNPNHTLNQIYGSSSQWMLFYLTEMWPGGTSKECPLADTTLLQTLFPETPLLGGRGKHFMANQTVVCEVTGRVIPTDACALRRLTIPTVITAISVN